MERHLNIANELRSDSATFGQDILGQDAFFPELDEVPVGLGAKMRELEDCLRSCNSIAIGFSGGVDSTFLAAACARCVPNRTTLIHLNTPFIPTPEREARDDGMSRLGLPTVMLEVDPLSCPQVAGNPADRCYRCKRLLFEELMRAATARGIDTVFDGSNADDATDYRPGTKALEELGVRSPLLECGWHKSEEREVLRAWGFDVWSMPAGACLATRIACGEIITPQKLESIRTCEDRVRQEGVRQVRARMSNGVISIHVTTREMHLISTNDGRNALLPHLMRDLLRLGASEVSPFVQPYQHGETSVQTA